jgi:hypothetical protein
LIILVILDAEYKLWIPSLCITVFIQRIELHNE